MSLLNALASLLHGHLQTPIVNLPVAGKVAVHQPLTQQQQQNDNALIAADGARAYQAAHPGQTYQVGQNGETFDGGVNPAFYNTAVNHNIPSGQFAQQMQRPIQAVQFSPRLAGINVNGDVQGSQNVGDIPLQASYGVDTSNQLLRSIVGRNNINGSLY